MEINNKDIWRGNKKYCIICEEELEGSGIDIMGYFVSGNDVYCLGNQGGMDIYKVQCGNVVKRIPYNHETSYRWRQIIKSSCYYTLLRYKDFLVMSNSVQLIVKMLVKIQKAYYRLQVVYKNKLKYLNYDIVYNKIILHIINK